MPVKYMVKMAYFIFCLFYHNKSKNVYIPNEKEPTALGFSSAEAIYNLRRVTTVLLSVA